MFDLLTSILKWIAFLPALALPAGIMGFILWRTAWQWRRLAEDYGVERVMPRVEKWGWLVLHSGLVTYNTQNGTTVAGVDKDALTLRLIPPFNLFHQPLRIPFRDITVKQTRWYINDNSWKLTTRRAPEIGIIMPEEYVRWIEKNAGPQWQPLGGQSAEKATTTEYRSRKSASLIGRQPPSSAGSRS